MDMYAARYLLLLLLNQQTRSFMWSPFIATLSMTTIVCCVYKSPNTYSIDTDTHARGVGPIFGLDKAKRDNVCEKVDRSISWEETKLSCGSVYSL